MSPLAWGLLVAAALFAAFVAFKSRYSLAGRNPAIREARKRLAEAKAKAREARRDPVRRAQALREAALIALDELGRPNLAASYARRAARAAPDDSESLHVAALAMRRARRYGALERLLWRRLDREIGQDISMGELIALYEGPLKRPEQARVLRLLWECHRSSRGLSEGGSR